MFDNYVISGVNEFQWYNIIFLGISDSVGHKNRTEVVALVGN